MHPLAKLDHAHVWHPFTQMRDWLHHEPIVITEGKGAVLRDARGREYLDANSSIWTNLHGHNHPVLNAAIQRQCRQIAHSSALGLANEPASLLAAELVALANRSSEKKSAGAETESAKGMFSQTAKPQVCSSTKPLTLTLSPSDGARGRIAASHLHSLTSDSIAAHEAPSLSPSDGERVRVRGSFDCILTAKAAPASPLAKVFFSDDGSTAVEVALKLAYEFTRRTRGPRPTPRFLSLENAYHGDTVGAVSLGHIDLFQRPYASLLFKSDAVMAPYCYRCPFNRAKPERADAREYRKCHWECVRKVEQKFAAGHQRRNPYAAFVFEPLIQGAAGMIPQPAGWLRQVTDLARAHGALLIADEVMTGFGRTGIPEPSKTDAAKPEALDQQKSVRTALRSTRKLPDLFACQHEGVIPDFLCLAKGLTGGYLPMAATLTTQKVFEAFLGDYEQFKTFFHGHSYTANQLGAATARASLSLLDSAASIRARTSLEKTLKEELSQLWALPNVGDIRQVGLVAGIELVREWRTREAFDVRERAGIRVCEAMARRGVLTRPIGNVIVLMPPYCTTASQARRMVTALHDAVVEVLGQIPRS